MVGTNINRTWYLWNQTKPEDLRNSPQIDFDYPEYSVTKDESWKIFYGEILYSWIVGDNSGKTCVDVKVRYKTITTNSPTKYV